MTTTQERIAAAVEKINPSFRARTGHRTLDVFICMTCTTNGWSVNVDQKRISECLPTLEAALDALDAHAAKVANSEDALARTLGIAS